jgi:hypothetical protein
MLKKCGKILSFLILFLILFLLLFIFFYSFLLFSFLVWSNLNLSTLWQPNGNQMTTKWQPKTLVFSLLTIGAFARKFKGFSHFLVAKTEVFFCLIFPLTKGWRRLGEGLTKGWRRLHEGLTKAWRRSRGGFSLGFREWVGPGRDGFQMAEEGRQYANPFEAKDYRL